MIVVDKGDVWGWVDPGLEILLWEDGSSQKLSTDLVEINWGRESGKLLSELDDVGYLNWMLRDAVDKNDLWQEKCVRLRLLELKD